MLLALLLAATSVYAAAGADVLALLPHPGKSHFMVFEPLLLELARRGHNITVLSFFPSSRARANYRDISLVGLADVHVATVDMAAFEPASGLDRVLHHYGDMTRLATYALDVCERLMTWPAAQELLEGRGRYDVVLVEKFNSDCMLGVAAARYRAPVVGLSSHALLPWVVDRVGVPFNPAYMPLLILPLGRDMNVWERLENAFFTQFYKLWFRRRVQAREQEILARRLGAAAVDVAAAAAETSLLLVNTHHSLSGVWPLPPAVVEVGGLHIDTGDKDLPDSVSRALEAGEAGAGAVLVSFGSLLNSSTMPPARVRSALAAFSRLPQVFLWKWETDTWPAPRPDNVFFFKWLPQQTLLSRPLHIF